jgi:hypothetical protein
VLHILPWHFGGVPALLAGPAPLTVRATHGFGPRDGRRLCQQDGPDMQYQCADNRGTAELLSLRVVVEQWGCMVAGGVVADPVDKPTLGE